MSHSLKIKSKSIAEQIASIRCKYPDFNTEFVSHTGLRVIGSLQPTSRSTQYQFVLNYNEIGPPKVKIITPELGKNSKGKDAEHLYKDGHLCLYQPKYQEFKRSQFLTETIIPWTSLWLYYYELWHLTGDWLGGGEHPTKRKVK